MEAALRHLRMQGLLISAAVEVVQSSGGEALFYGSTSRAAAGRYRKPGTTALGIPSVALRPLEQVRHDRVTRE